MKNYSRTKATKGKTAFRTGDRWRARKNTVVRDIKSLYKWKNTTRNTKQSV